MFGLDKWLKPFEPFLRRVSEAVVYLFERHPIRIAIAAALVVSALVTGNYYVDRTREYQNIVSTTVRAETEDTPQRFKVLEAFIMSTIDEQLSTTIRQARISKGFTTRLNDVHRILTSPPTAPALPGSQDTAASGIAKPGDAATAVSSGLPKAESQPIGAYISIPDYVQSFEELPSQNAILTDDADNGYLFFPLNLLRTRWDRKYKDIFTQSKAGNATALANAIARDPAIVDDIDVSRRLLPAMMQFATTPLFDALDNPAADVRPVQIYYITKNGLNRIVNNTASSEQKVVYRNMFRSTTFFPSRPYYVEAFRKFATDRRPEPPQVEPQPIHLEGLTGNVEDAFYVSQPYLDIGGFGVVITLARPVRYANHSDAAICFDLPVRLEVTSQLKERLKTFGATSHDVRCDIGFRGRITCNPVGDTGSVGVPQTNILKERLNATMKAGDLSTVVGNISILSDPPPRRGNVSHAGVLDFLTYPNELMFGRNTRPITFAIPKESPSTFREGDERGLRAEFLIASLNLDRFQQVTTLAGLVSVALLASAFMVVLLSWQGEMQARQSFERAFKTVDKVLYGAPTAYCRLNARDEIADCNTAFCDLLKMPADLQSVTSLTGVTFESLLAPRSKATYQDVQERRRAGKDVPPYTLYFLRKDDTEVETRVTSGVIPGRTRRELPETFGIVITSPNVPA